MYSFVAESRNEYNPTKENTSILNSITSFTNLRNASCISSVHILHEWYEFNMRILKLLWLLTSSEEPSLSIPFIFSSNPQFDILSLTLYVDDHHAFGDINVFPLLSDSIRITLFCFPDSVLRSSLTHLMSYSKTWVNLSLDLDNLKFMAEGCVQLPMSTAVSDWKKSILDSLNAHYERHDIIDFDFDFAIPSMVQEGKSRVSLQAEFLYRYRRNSKRIWACQ